MLFIKSACNHVVELVGSGCLAVSMRDEAEHVVRLLKLNNFWLRAHLGHTLWLWGEGIRTRGLCVQSMQLLASPQALLCISHNAKAVVRAQTRSLRGSVAS